jgi:glycosyltransferase involved in cell wall biosynthesis
LTSAPSSATIRRTTNPESASAMTRRKSRSHHAARKEERPVEVPVAASEPALRKKKILIVAHNHPNFFPGGAEISAYDLFRTLKEHGLAEPFFMAGVTPEDRGVHTGTPFQQLVQAEDEILFWGANFDYFYQSQNIKNFLYLDFRLFLEKLRPDVIHFHHTMRIGLEALQVARQTLPGVKIIYTLHEYILMCHRDGQMVRTQTEELCAEASPARCHQCFPERSPAEFKMRESFIKAHLQHVDRFVAPSAFLAERFIRWGIPRENMQVLENGRKAELPAPFRELPAGGTRNVFGYFGQINPYKGALLALRAAEDLLRRGFSDFRLELFGNAEQQSAAFKEEFARLLERTQACVSFHGKYRNADLPALMAQVDWVLMPSTWWENSPLVIQEAFLHLRPVIASDIGGMAEKVEPGVTGLHFQVRNERSLAKVMREACEDPALWPRLVSNIGPRLSLEESAEQHLELYARA